MKKSSLHDLLAQLYWRLNKRAKLRSDVSEKITLLIESNGLGQDENVPAWLKNFFFLILQGQSTEKLYIDTAHPKGTDVDVWNFLAELEDLITMDCDDSGEDIEMFFRELGVYALISIEGGFIQIQSIRDPHCASYALEKIMKFMGEST